MSGKIEAISSRPWDIRASAADGSGGWLRLGHRAFALRDIVGVSVANHPAQSLDAALVLGIGVAVIGVVLAPTMAMGGASVNLLPGIVVLGATVWLGADEMRRRRATEIYRLEIRLRDGTAAEFSTAEASELDALRDALAQRLSQNSAPSSS